MQDPQCFSRDGGSQKGGLLSGSSVVLLCAGLLGSLAEALLSGVLDKVLHALILLFVVLYKSPLLSGVPSEVLYEEVPLHGPPFSEVPDPETEDFALFGALLSVVPVLRVLSGNPP